MTFILSRRTAAAIAASICMAIPAVARADSNTEPAPTPAFPSADFRAGDNPADHPGMSRAPQYEGPTTIEVVRPERTIVRDVNEALPIALSGAALLLALAALAGMLIRGAGRLVPRSHRRS